MMTYKKILILILIFFSSPFAYANPIFCSKAFSQEISKTSSQSVFLTEAQNLINHDLTVEMLPSFEVIKLTSQNGKSFALRFNTSMNNLLRGQFIQAILTENFDLRLPDQVLLNTKMSEQLLKALSHHHEAFSLIQQARQMTESANETFHMSLTEWVDLPTGSHWIHQHSTVEFALGSQILFPTKDHLDFNRNIATAWVITSTLGILDMHGSNWLTDGTSLISIDLALKFYPVTKKENPFHLAMGPFSHNAISIENLKSLVELSDPNTLLKLKELSFKDFKNIADSVGYKLPQQEFQSFQQRLNYIFNLN